jgi:small redox-active disulfide protein 2
VNFEGDAIPAGRVSPLAERVMKEVKVLGTGCCGNCQVTAKLIEDVARTRGVEIRLEKVERLEEIAAAGVMRTPGVIVDGRLVHSGGVPRREAVEAWL